MTTARRAGAITAVITGTILAAAVAVPAGARAAAAPQAGTKTVTITAKSKSKTYGSTDPTFTYTTSGLASGDKLTTAPKCSVSAAHTNAGKYTIACSGAKAGTTYALKYVTGTLTVTKAALTITPASQTRYTNQADPSFTYTVAGLKKTADHLVTAPTCGVVGDHSVAGRYPITCLGADAGRNYMISYGAGVLTVLAPNVVYIAGNSAQKFYGAADPVIGYSQAGLPAGSSLVTEPTCAAATPHTDAGDYPITCSGAVAPAGYSVVYLTGPDHVLRVLPVGLLIYADYAQKLYGAPDPALPYTAIGLHTGDTLRTEPTCTVSGTHTGVGDYPIVCGGADAGPDYVITYTTSSGTILRILPAPLLVAATNQATFYGAGDPSFGYSVAGLKDGDAFTTNPTCAVAVAHTHAGTYPITCSGGDAGPNYSIIYSDGSLLVQKAVTSLKAQPYSLLGGVVSATLYAAVPFPYSSPLAGASVTFTSGGTTLCTAVTDQYGTASCSLGLGDGLTASGGYTATYAGTTDYAAATDTVKGS